MREIWRKRERERKLEVTSRDIIKANYLIYSLKIFYGLKKRATT